MRSTLGRWLVCGAIGVAALAAAQHFQLGVEFYRAGDYAAARVEVEAAFGLSQLPDLLHNLSLTAEMQGRTREAIEYEERFLATKRGELTTAEIDEARGRLLRLRERQSGTQTAPTAQAVPARSVEAGAPGWRPPAGALALLAGGGAALVAGIACGGVALATGAQLSSGQAFTLREIDALTSRGNALNASAIALDVVGGVALTAGAAWTIADWLKRGRSERRATLAPLRPTDRAGQAFASE